MFSALDNYFNILNLEENFDIDKESLYQNYIKLQQAFHPDKAINKSHVEKMQVLEFTVTLNKAYQILNDNKLRAEYLLSLNNIHINKEEPNINPDPVMLNDMLDLSEEIIEANLEQLKAIRARVNEQIEECWISFKENYAISSFEDAASAIIKLQYLNKIIDQLNSRD